MDIKGSVAVVTGANRGIGRHFAQQLLDRGATTVYAAARDPESIDLPGVEAIALDITDTGHAQAAARAAADATLLINNAGITTHQGLIDGDIDTIRSEMETNFFGTLNVVRAFAPVLAANGGGAILNMLSVSSWFAFPGHSSYSAAKAAEWSLTDGIRLELAGQRTQVTGVHVGLVDTEMSDWTDLPKSDPADVAAQSLDAIESGAQEVLADENAVGAKASLASDPSERYAGSIATVLD